MEEVAITKLTPRKLRDMLNEMIFAQDMREWNGMIQYVKGARSILEIGSRFGESIYHMAREIEPPGRVVCVDLPAGDGCPVNPEPSLRERANDICAMGHDFHGILASSRDKEVIERVRSLGPFDFCFIDGDHTYNGVRSDWENYGSMCKIVAFHDICGQEGCRLLWQELKNQYRTVEFTDSMEFFDPRRMGIGVLFREAN